MHISHEQTEGHRRLQVGDVVPCGCCFGSIEEHQEDARHRQQDKEEEAQPTETQGVTDLHGVTLHLYRVKVVQHRVHNDV